MKKFKGVFLKTGIILFLGAVMLTSCVPMKKIRYMQDPKNVEYHKSEFMNKDTTAYIVHRGDNLYIKVNTLEDKNNYFEDLKGGSEYYTESAIYLNSYTVNDSGYVEFPLIGKVKADNLTVDQIRKELQLKVDEYIKNTVVIVKLANFRISMLGEFNHPGKYLVNQDKINIFEAISLAGDMTDFARRNKVLLMRQSETGVKTTRLNLNDYSIMESEYYYLMPNDIVYVEPLKGKQFAFSEFPYVLLLSTLTTTILLLDYFNN